MKKYYAGIGSREISYKTNMIFQQISNLLEKEDYILRSGGASGSDTAFESAVKSSANMNIYLPFKSFNGHTSASPGYIYIENLSENYDAAYESLLFHPAGKSLNSGPKAMMIRNYFQAMGQLGEPKSDFIICYTKDGANGLSIKTSRDSGGTGQAIRIGAANGIPIYNLADTRYSNLSAIDLVTMILENLKTQHNPDKVQTNEFSLF